MEFDLTVEDILELWERQSGRCALSGVLLTHQRDGADAKGRKEFNASLDRINPQGPYNRQNTQLVASRINTLKHTLSEDMLMWWLKNILEHQKSKTEN